MRTLTGSSIPNIDTSDTTNYPKGRFKNDTGLNTNDGTEVSERTLGDLYQAFVEILRIYGETPDENPEHKDNSQIAKCLTGNGLLSKQYILDNNPATFTFARNVLIADTTGTSHIAELADISGGHIGEIVKLIMDSNSPTSSQLILKTTNTNIQYTYTVGGTQTDITMQQGDSMELVKIADSGYKWQMINYYKANN